MAETVSTEPLPLVPKKRPVFNRGNVLQAVEGVGDLWSEGSRWCEGGGLAYWLAVSKAKRDEIRQLHRDDPVKQREALIAFWFAVNSFLTWARVSRAVQRVGQTEQASLISTYGQPPTGMAFTCSNILKAVRTVDYDVLGLYLYISKDKRTAIRETYTDPEEHKRQLILYWFTTDPLASWRRLITQLDNMSQSPVADAIRDYAEPLADSTQFDFYQHQSGEHIES